MTKGLTARQEYGYREEALYQKLGLNKEIEEFSLEIRESAYGGPPIRTIRMSRISYGPIFCKNTTCDYGGINLFLLLGEMVQQQETARQIDPDCKGIMYGSQSSPPKSCPHGFKGTITIKYWEPAPKPTDT